MVSRHTRCQAMIVGIRFSFNAAGRAEVSWCLRVNEELSFICHRVGLQKIISVTTWC